MNRKIALLLSFAAAWSACEIPRSEAVELSMHNLQDVTEEDWSRLAGRRIFFGHQSVGDNLMEGMAAVLRANPQIPVRVVAVADPSEMAGPGLYHALVGQNGAPQSKLDAFQRFAGTPGALDVALVKFCYVDVTADTDPEELFASYREAVERLRHVDPGLTIVHVTLPLNYDPGMLFHLRTIIRGNTSFRELNRLREDYNHLVRSTFGGKEPVFDLARLESIGPDGGENLVSFDGQRVPVMASAWTSDGGHLTPEAARRMAEVLLATLARS